MPLSDYYPDLICNLPKFSGRFDARKLSAENCDVLFATYPAGTLIEPQRQLSRLVSGTTFQLTKNTAPNFEKIPARLNSGSLNNKPAFLTLQLAGNSLTN
jgi:hypothetical protein